MMHKAGFVAVESRCFVVADTAVVAGLMGIELVDTEVAPLDSLPLMAGESEGATGVDVADLDS